MLAWTQQNTMQRAMWTVLEWPQSHAISKTINMLTNKSEPQQKCRLGTVSKILLGGLNRFYGILKSDCKQPLRIGIIRALNECTGRLFRATTRHNHKSSDMQSKKISNDQELIQSDPISCPQNQKGNN